MSNYAESGVYFLSPDERVVQHGRPCSEIRIHLGAGDAIFVTPKRKRAPRPKPGDPVTICWILSPDGGLGWNHDGPGVELKSPPWDTGWPTPARAGGDYELTVTCVGGRGCPKSKTPYPYKLHLRLGEELITIDPEIEYDDD